MTALRLVVRGRVQGVGYRAWAVRTARALALHGWVRNRRDGSVEILAAGDSDALQRLVAACRQGPAAAAVSAVEQYAAEPPDQTGFDQAATE
jgi:acylphosphatase